MRIIISRSSKSRGIPWGAFNSVPLRRKKNKATAVGQNEGSPLVIEAEYFNAKGHIFPS